jgi:hypothetical protein
MQHKITLPTITTIILFSLAACLNAYAQDWKTEKKINVMFGLSQPIVTHGFNMELDYVHKRFIFDFSQGVFLKFKGNFVTDELRKRGVVVHMPWTTGFGVGYRLTRWLNLRVEPKWHRFEFYYNNEIYQSNKITSYNTFTLGMGLYACFQPFRKKENFLKGLVICPSIRYWPTVCSTLKDNNFNYYNEYTGTNEKIKTVGPGLGLTPFVLNVSIGYSFQIKKKKQI